jgi:hypothetical protein
MACGDLITSLVLDCNTIVQGGVGDDSRLTLILKKDISATTTDTLGRITGFTLLSGKTAYSIDGIKQSLKPRYEAQVSPSGQTVYKHQVDFSYFDYSQVHKNNIQSMGAGRYVCIFSNAKADGSAFEVLGLDVGLGLTAAVRAPQENQGAFIITLASPEGEFESKLPPNYFVTDYNATVTAVNNLIALPTISNVSPLAAGVAGGTALTFTGTNFFGGGTNNAVTNVSYVNQSTGAVVNQATYTVASTTSITATSVAMTAGVYKVRITTIKGVALSVQNLIVS